MENSPDAGREMAILEHIEQAERKKLRYIIAPEGIALRNRLAGYQSVIIDGEGEVADVRRLTCIEQGLEITRVGDAPVLEVRDLIAIAHMDGDT